MTFSFLIRQRAISSRMSMCLLNARSINNKALFIKDYVVDHQSDILGITETWTKSDGESNRVVNELSPRGYSFIHVPRKNDLVVVLACYITQAWKSKGLIVTVMPLLNTWRWNRILHQQLLELQLFQTGIEPHACVQGDRKSSDYATLGIFMFKWIKWGTSVC